MALRRYRRGGNAIEFAMTMPLMVGLLGGIMDYALYFNTRSGMYQAALSGARVGSVLPNDESPAAAQTEVVAVLDSLGIDSGAATIDCQIVDINGEDAVSVDISMAYNGIVVPAFMPSTIQFTMAMRLENQ